MELGLDSEEELEYLQNLVKQMDDRILHYRQILPNQLKEEFTLLASDQISDEAEDERGFEDRTLSCGNQGTSSSSNFGVCGFLLGTKVHEFPREDGNGSASRWELCDSSLSA